MLQDDPDRVVAELLPSLNQADLKFREINKKIILALLENFTRPIKTLNDRKTEAIVDIILGVITKASAFLAPDFSQDVQAGHVKMRRLPEETRQTDLKNTVDTLEILTHKERLEFFMDSIFNGVSVSNNKWWAKLHKEQRVKYRRVDINTQNKT